MVNECQSEASEFLKAPVEFMWVGGVDGVVCTHSHFHVQPNYSVEVVLWLGCFVVGDVKKNKRNHTKTLNLH